MTRRLIDFARAENRRKVVPLAGFPGTQLTGSSLKPNLQSAEQQTESLLRLAERTQPDAMFAMMDLSVEAESVGLSVRFPDNESPSVESHPVHSVEDLEALEQTDAVRNRMNVFADTVRRLKRELDIPVGAYVAGPYTLAGLLMGASEIAMACITNPELVRRAVSFSESVITDYADRLEHAGADMICILDPTAMMLSPEMFREFAGASSRRIIERLDCPTILHICGNTTHLVEAMCETGADALSLDADVSMSDVLPRMPDDCVLIGNINPVSTVKDGPRKRVFSESVSLLQAMREAENFVFSTGCDLPQDTPIENICAMIEATREYNRTANKADHSAIA